MGLESNSVLCCVLSFMRSLPACKYGDVLVSCRGRGIKHRCNGVRGFTSQGHYEEAIYRISIPGEFSRRRCRCRCRKRRDGTG